MTGTLSRAEVDAARAARHRSALLFLTDRCPVGCAHCSVDSRPDAPRLDLDLLGELLAGLLAVPGLAVVGISGGEPFAERRALTLAVQTLAAERQVVLYTSGVWAFGRAGWVPPILRRCAHVVLSTDAQHAARLPADRFVAAAQAVHAAGVPLSVQVTGDPAPAADLLARAFGPGWAAYAELVPIPLLPYGRAAGTLRLERRPGSWFGRCPVADAPVLRYDGRLAGCCNEQVLTGQGPASLRRTVRTAAEVVAGFAALNADPYLRAVSRIGLGPLTKLAGAGDLATREFADPCRLCWALAGRLGGRR